MLMSASRSLFRQLLRESKKFDNYNFRTYALRSTKSKFRANAGASGEEVDKLLQNGRKDLELIRRQTLIGSLYHPEEAFVIEHSK